MTALVILFAIAAVPYGAIVVVRSVRYPIGIALACYAAVIPFGSGIELPIGLPEPFDTVSTLLGIWVIAVVAVYLGKEARWAPLHPSVPVWLALVALVVASYGWSVNRITTVQNANVFVGLVVLLVLISLVPSTLRDIQAVEVGAIVGGVAACLYGVWLLRSGRLTATADAVPRFATAGGVGDGADPNITAASLLVPLILALKMVLSARKRSLRAISFAAFALIATGIVLTGSRGGALAAIIGCIVLLTVFRGARMLAPLLAIIAAVAIVFMLVPSSLSDRFTETTSTGRTDVWSIGARACSSYCIHGSGWGTFPDVYRSTLLTNFDLKGHGVQDFKAHNIALAMLVELGVFGVLLAVTGLLLVAASVVRLPTRLRGPPLAALVAVVTANMFVSNFNFKYFWFALTYCMIVVSMEATTILPRTRGARDESRRAPEVPAS